MRPLTVAALIAFLLTSSAACAADDRAAKFADLHGEPRPVACPADLEGRSVFVEGEEGVRYFCEFTGVPKAAVRVTVFGESDHDHYLDVEKNEEPDAQLVRGVIGVTRNADGRYYIQVTKLLKMKDPGTGKDVDVVDSDQIFVDPDSVKEADGKIAISYKTGLSPTVYKWSYRLELDLRAGTGVYYRRIQTPRGLLWQGPWRRSVGQESHTLTVRPAAQS